MFIDETLSLALATPTKRISWKAERTKSHVLAKHPNRCYLTPLHDKSKSNQAGTGQEPGRNRAGSQEPGRNRAGTGRWAGTGQEPGRNRAGTGQEPGTAAGQEPGSNRAGAGQQPHGRTTPIRNLKTLAFAAISIFLPVFCSAEKRLTTRTRTCRGRAPEAAPDHRTRQIAPLLCAGASYHARHTQYVELTGGTPVRCFVILSRKQTDRQTDAAHYNRYRSMIWTSDTPQLPSVAGRSSSAPKRTLTTLVACGITTSMGTANLFSGVSLPGWAQAVGWATLGRHRSAAAAVLLRAQGGPLLSGTEGSLEQAVGGGGIRVAAWAAVRRSVSTVRPCRRG
jgi:hypothetical protein